MNKREIRKRLKPDEWDERSIKYEEEETLEAENDWNEKEAEEYEEGEIKNDFHEEDYDK